MSPTFIDPKVVAEARRLVEKHGYGRRRGELADLEIAAEEWPEGATPDAPEARPPG